jgi:hypothetical protein
MVDLASRDGNGEDPDPAPPLTRRVPGAQPPQTVVHGLRRGLTGGVAVAPDAPPDDMYQQLSKYADGLERGRSERQD